MTCTLTTTSPYIKFAVLLDPPIYLLLCGGVQSFEVFPLTTEYG